MFGAPNLSGEGVNVRLDCRSLFWCSSWCVLTGHHHVVQVLQHAAAINGAGPIFAGSGAVGALVGGQHPLAVPHAGSFIAGPALPAPVQAFLPPQAALSASIAFPHLVSHIQQSW
jgi:hypothetical protein